MLEQPSNTKVCCHCGKLKRIEQYRRTKKTLDRLYPYCKKCSFDYKESIKSEPLAVALMLWNDINDLAFSSVTGTKTYYNKTMFLEFIQSSPKFQELYKLWVAEEYDTVKIDINLTDHLKGFVLENFELSLRKLEPDETLVRTRIAPSERIK